MANDGGSNAFLGVLVGGLLVLMMVFVLVGTGVFGNKSTVTVQLPKVTTTK